MKKLLSIILTTSIILSCMTAFAKTDVSLDFLSNIPSSFEASGKLSMKLNKPLKILNYAKDDFHPYIAYQELAESLLKADVKMNVKMITEDNGVIKTYCDFDVKTPFTLNDCLNGNINAKMFTWTEIDTTNGYKATSIVKSPANTKFVITKAELTDDVAVLLKELMPNSAGFKIANAEKIRAIKKNSTVTKKGNNVYIEISNEQVKSLIKDLIKSLSIIPDIQDSDIDSITEFLDKINIFADKAIEYKYTLKNGKITNVKSTINIKTNVYDLASQGGYVPTEWNRNDTDIDLKLTSELSYKYNKVNIDFPVLTNENSIDTSVNEFDEYYEDEFYDEEYYGCSYYLFTYFVDSESEYKEVLSTDYYDVEKLAKAFYEYDEDGYIVEKSDNKIFVKSDYNQTEFEVNVGSNQVIVNGNIIDLDKPAIIKDGNIFVGVDFVNKVFQAIQNSNSFNYVTGSNETECGQFEFAIPCYE